MMEVMIMRFKSLFLASLLMLVSALPAMAVGTLALGPVSATGTNIEFNVTLTNDAAIQLSALGVDIGFNQTVFGIIPDVDSGPGFTLNAELGAAANTAKKNLDQSNPSSGLLRFAISGKTTTIGDGVVAKITFPIKSATPGTYTFAITPTGSDKNAAAYVLTGVNTTYTIQAQPATVSTFTIPSTVESSTKTIPITAFTGANATGFIITETATAPAASDAKWSATKPETYIASSYGVKTLYAWVKNSTNTVSATSLSASTTLTEPAGPDLTPPTLTVTSPAEGLKTKELTLNIAGTVTDASGIASLTVNGATVTVGTNGTFTYPLSLTTEGPVAINIVATDNAAAHNATTVTRNITYDKTPMTLTISAPSSDNSKTKELSVTVAGTISEAGGTVKIENKTSNVSIAATVTETNYTGSVQLNEGDNNIQVTGTDQAGNTTALSRTITRDSIPPALAITDPSHDVQVTVATVTIKGTTDATATEVKLTFNGVDHTQTITAGTFAFEQAITIPAVDAVYPVVVTAKDAAGNSSSVTRNIVYTQVPGDIGAAGIEKIVEALKAFQSAHNILPTPLTALEKLKLDCAPLNADGTPNPDGVIDGGDVILLLRRAAGLPK
jgi:hypothetical protein